MGEEPKNVSINLRPVAIEIVERYRRRWGASRSATIERIVREWREFIRREKTS